MSREQREMMEDEDKLMDRSGSPLTYLFRQVLRELGISVTFWNNRLTRYLKSPLSRCPKNSKDIGQERNNFNRAVAKNEITFKTFLKALHILGPVKYSMSITLVLKNDEKVTIETPMFKNPYAIMDSLTSVYDDNRAMSQDPHDDQVDEEEEITDDEVSEYIDQIPYIEDDSDFYDSSTNS